MRKNQNNNINSIGIKELIERERQEGLEVFRKTDFPAKLEARIGSGKKPKYFWPFWLKRTVPVLGVLLAIIVIVVIVKSFFIPATTPLEVVFVIEEFLSQSPNMQRVLLYQNREDMPITPGTEEFYPFEWSIQRIIFSVKRERIKDEDIPLLIYEVLDKIDESGKKKWVLYPEEESLRNLLDGLKNMRKTGRTSELFSQILKKLEEV